MEVPSEKSSIKRHRRQVSTHLHDDEKANNREYLRVKTYPVLPVSGEDTIIAGSVYRADTPSVQEVGCFSRSGGVIPKTKDSSKTGLWENL
ncbi:uncharacterized protein TrAFT101_005657 [Trichoderma asperellum]|uniref:uncharacterized protein n=1 Tax=Trichoderma asperellum TaxID=101201 RepID=UPI0033300D75|nr:hypothetical protein TrAFT101_005657 [Trichoderma asperellum]